MVISFLLPFSLVVKEEGAYIAATIPLSPFFIHWREQKRGIMRFILPLQHAGPCAIL